MLKLLTLSLVMISSTVALGGGVLLDLQIFSGAAPQFLHRRAKYQIFILKQKNSAYMTKKPA